jgi:acyl-coenzyme A synthetase/AMP-(fatty) acid ligase/fructoselysine-6-P-deglycase FrlB-like protein
MTWDAFLEGATRIAESELDRVAGRVQPDDVTTILYTSGTTGFPKGAQLTHRGMLQNAAAVGGNLRLGPADRICLAVPLHHCFGAVMGTLAAITYGATLVLPSDGFDAGATLAAVASERCSVIYGVPTMFAALVDHASRPTTDLTSLRAGIVAGSPVPLDLARRIERELHVPGLVVAYGLTEASPVVTQTALDDTEEVRLGTVGRPIIGAEVRAVDPGTGLAVPVGTPGELVTRGPMVMRGYFEMPDETNAAIDRDGWLHTGDLAVRDGRGTWAIVGRLKDMIIRGGENVYPAEVEAVGRRLEGIREIQVVGVPSDYFGEEVFAWVQPAPGATLTADGLRTRLGEHLARFQVPAHIGFVESWPLTGSGKVQKGVLREMAVAAVRGAGALPGAALAPPSLPLLAPKTPLLEGRTGDGASVMAGAATPPGAPERVPDETDVVLPGRRSATLPPHPGWTRPERAAWRWQPRTRIPEPTTQEGTVSLDDVRRRGQRIKTWGIGGNVREQIESTGEEPIMYKALGTPPQTQHPFNLYGDIRSQPEALRGTFEHCDEIDQIARTLADRDFAGIVGLGSGTSQFVAQVANAAFARFAGIPGWDYDSQAFLRYPPPFDYSRMLAVAYSGSGSTVDTVAAARDCRTRGSYTLSFTSVEGSPVVQATDARILTAGGFDTGGSDTFHYTTRIAAAIYLALEVGRLRNPGAHDYEGLKRTLKDTPRLMADMFDTVDKRCRTIADMFLGVRSILVVGAGANFGTAEEIALKFDEMAHIPSKSMNPGRHIHGALGLTEESILTVLVAPPGTAYKDLHDIAKVTQLLKSPAVAIVSDEDQEIADIVDYVVRIPVQDEVIFSVLAVLPGQLLPYWCGVGLGLNPDTQRSNVPKHARVWNMLFPPGTH